MKIAWFTPFSQKSAIGRYSVSATDVLAEMYDICICIAKEETDEELHETMLPKMFYSIEDDEKIRNQFDLCVYNMGNNYSYHKYVYEMSKRIPGIVIVHDVSVRDFVYGYCMDKPGGWNVFHHMLVAKYLDKAGMIMDASKDTEDWNALPADDYNMSEEVLKYGITVIVHSQYHRSIVKKNYKGSISVLPLLYGEDSDMGDRSRTDSDKIMLLTIGGVVPNKRYMDTLKAISDIKAREIEYHIIGSLKNADYVGRMKDYIKENGLSDVVTLHGYLADDEIKEYLAKADIVVNLRYPAFEGGSGSLQEAMFAGKAIIVTNTGVYGEIDDTAVMKCRHDHMSEDIVAHLTNIINDRELIHRYASAARRYAKEHFSKERYADGFAKVVKKTMERKPVYDVVSNCQDILRLSGDRRWVNDIVAELEDWQ